MDDKKKIWVGPQVNQDVEFIEAHSPDVLVDLGLLMHVLAKRSWRGADYGLTGVPTNWLGKVSFMGHRRVRASLDRLVAYGILTLVSPPGEDKVHHRATRVKYAARDCPPSLPEEEEEK